MFRPYRNVVWTAALAAAGLGTQPLAAQVIFGSIQGTVSDATGAVVAGVKVAAKNLDTGVAVSTASNSAGLYFLGEIRPGRYEVEASAEGFSKYVQTGVTVRIDDRLRIDIQLKLGQVSESVEVVAEAPLVQSESTTIGKVMEEKAIKQLPLAGRNGFALTLLTPGTMQRNDDEQPRLSGGRTRTAEVTLDGSSVTDPRRGETAYSPNLDAIQEFKVQTNGLSAEYGRLVGGVVNATLKSGTNEFHGNVFEFLRNNKLNARNTFATTVPKLAYNQFGGMIGGPIRRNRTFFFADYEGTRNRNDRLFNLTLPTEPLKRGDFSSLGGGSVGVGALGRPVAANQIFDPASTRRAPDGRQVRDQFPGNIIPASRFDPAAAKVVALWAEPNQTGIQNFRLLKPAGNEFDKFDVRIDHRFSDKDLFFARVSNDRQNNITARPYEFSGTGGQVGQINTFFTSALNWTRTINPTTLNDVRATAFRGRLHRILSPADNTSLGIPNIDPKGLPRVNVPGYDPLGDSAVFDPTQEQYQIQDIVTLVRSRHIVKIGADVRRFRINDLQLEANGVYTLARNQTAEPGFLGSTGHPLASLLLGQIDRFANDTNRGRFYQRSSYFGFFVQDDFKVTPNFTLNMGLRYDVEQQPNETRFNGSNFDLFSGRVITMRELGANRVERTDKNNFGPRFGFAWRPFGLKRTVVRSHYGVFFIPLTGRATSAFNRFPRSQQVQSASNGVDAVAVLSRTPAIVGTEQGFGLQQQYSDSNQRAGYFQQYSFDLQQELAGNILLQATYAAGLGRKLMRNFQWNEIPLERARELVTTRQQDRPYAQFGDIISHIGRQNSSYHSLQLSIEKRYSSGLMLLGSYTLSKLIDEAEDNFAADLFPMTIYNMRLEKGLSQAHIPQRMVTSAVYELPFGKGRRYAASGIGAALAGGWEMSGILALQSGEQVLIRQANNTARTFSRGFRPNITSNPILPAGERAVARWFNTAAFQAPAPLTLGTTNKTPGIEGPGEASVSLGLHRIIRLPLTESTRLEIRGECFNCLNRVNYNVASGVFGTPQFGTVTSAGTARFFQFALKFWF